MHVFMYARLRVGKGVRMCVSVISLSGIDSYLCVYMYVNTAEQIHKQLFYCWLSSNSY